MVGTGQQVQMQVQSTHPLTPGFLARVVLLRNLSGSDGLALSSSSNSEYPDQKPLSIRAFLPLDLSKSGF